ncbi:energy transducer TonB [Roseateles sp.]|uniref:energy transducer TonB n=1 Tax=Roseateles sp. TaxID=1971397 RepID=UPI0025F00166|nr:energy transducer TonB [Roseateles sp.]MBV8035463.1 energy transducer TonB [Roseateles sp.]
MKPLAFVAPTAVAAPSRLAVSHVAQPRPGYAELSQPPRSRRLLLVGIAALHLLGFWALSQMQDMRRAVARVAPVVVRLIAPAEPPKPLPPPPVAMPELKVPATTLIEPPLIAIAVAPAPSPVVAALPPPPPVVAVPVQAAPAPVVQVAPPPAPRIKQIPASAVRYLREPRMTVPLMSKRLRESGVVHLRVVVDARGQPREITLAKSSGFARLDEQALLDMRSARFAPYMENGQPVEWEVIAPMSYEVDR